MTRAAFPIARDLAALQRERFDVLVVGGGIYGAWTAYDAALRGLSVGLIERDDWGSGTSSASSKLIHGGLRYLEYFDFALVRHALIERRALARLAPHLVRPLNFVLPVWKGARVGMTRLNAGLILYDWLSLGWQPVQRHRRYERERLLKRYPFLVQNGLRGGFRYGDCQEDDARVTLVVAAAAQAAGAVLARRVTAVRLLEVRGQVVGVEARAAESENPFAVHAKCVVNAAGPWADTLLGAHAPRVRRVKGTHLVLPAIPDCHSAFLLTAPQDGRVFFVIPWYGRTLIGTTESDVASGDVAPTPEEERYLLAAANAWLPGLGWTAHDVIGRFSGTRALQAQQKQNLAAVTREFTILEPRPGVLLPLGGKFTTSRHDAALIVDRVGQALRRRLPDCATAERPLPGAPVGEFGAWQEAAMARLVAAGVDADAARWVSHRHGTRSDRIVALLGENPRWAERVHPQAPFIDAEVILAVRDEDALELEDVVRRRMPLALLVTAEEAWRQRVQRLMLQVSS